MDISEDHQQFLSFSWLFDGGERKYFTFTNLPFGLSCVSLCFTKFFRKVMRKKGTQKCGFINGVDNVH